MEFEKRPEIDVKPGDNRRQLISDGVLERLHVTSPPIMLLSSATMVILVFMWALTDWPIWCAGVAGMVGLAAGIAGVLAENELSDRADTEDAAAVASEDGGTFVTLPICQVANPGIAHFLPCKERESGGYRCEMDGPHAGHVISRHTIEHRSMGSGYGCRAARAEPWLITVSAEALAAAEAAEREADGGTR